MKAFQQNAKQARRVHVLAHTAPHMAQVVGTAIEVCKPGTTRLLLVTPQGMSGAAYRLDLTNAKQIDDFTFQTVNREKQPAGTYRIEVA